MPLPLASVATPVPPHELAAALTLGVATLTWTLYHFAIAAPVVRRLYPAATSPAALATATSWHRRGLGALIFGAAALITAAALGLPLGLNLDHLSTSLAWTAGAYALIAPILWLQARSPAFRAHYPEVRAPFTPRLRLANAAAWLAYLTGYELFFRGLLVLGLAQLLGPFSAVAASLMLYVVTHLNRYLGEALGSAFIGLFLSYITLTTGSLVAPLLLHLLIALTADELAARAAGRP